MLRRSNTRLRNEHSRAGHKRVKRARLTEDNPKLIVVCSGLRPSTRTRRKFHPTPARRCSAHLISAKCRRFRNSSFSSLGGRGYGATANLYLGYDYMLLNNFLVGAEIEGGLSNTRTTMAGGMSGLQQNVSSVTNFGVSSTSTTTSTNTGNTVLNMENRWVVSALARSGFLVDPKDMIYLVGGVTYGSFELIDQSNLGTFGGTVGAGWERKITPSWTFKAEYRYTRFQDRTVTESVASNSSGAGNTSTNDTLVSSKITGLDWHAVTIGVSHYFDAN